MKTIVPALAATLLALALTGCASRPKPAPPTADVGAPPAEAWRAPGEAATAGVRPGSQEDLAAQAGDRVYFAVDSHALTAEAQAVLARQAAWLARYPTARVIVAGNADERGTREYNLGLGARRAGSVRDALIAQGVAASRMQTVSYGKERPIAFGDDEAAWSLNRNGHTVLVEAAGDGWRP